MRIAVLADTHDRIPEGLPAALAGADEIWHLGDVCAPATLAALAAGGRPLCVVRGNCDAHEWPEELRLTREGVRFYLAHIPPALAPGRCAAILHGHTHVPRDEVRAGVRWLNPGCITRPRAGVRSFAWLTVEAGRLTGWQTVAL